MADKTFANLLSLAAYLRQLLETRKYILLYAYNGAGKTRLSMEFKNLGKNDDARDTLYFNAYNEDLFYWDNGLKNDERCVVRLNQQIKGTTEKHNEFLKELELPPLP